MPHAHPSGFPPRALECTDDGEGQVFPPPYGEGDVFYRSAGACHHDVEGFMKHPHLTIQESEEFPQSGL